MIKKYSNDKPSSRVQGGKNQFPAFLLGSGGVANCLPSTMYISSVGLGAKTLLAKLSTLLARTHNMI
jgi:hypothetical protein